MTATRLEKLIAIILLYIIAFFVHLVIIYLPPEMWAFTIVITMMILTTKTRRV